METSTVHFYLAWRKKELALKILEEALGKAERDLERGISALR